MILVLIMEFVRYYTVQQMESNGPWLSVPERVDPQLTSYTVVGLKPFTTYKFRIQATNDIGPSGWSPESVEIRTLPAGKNLKRTLCKRLIELGL